MPKQGEGEAGGGEGAFFSDGESGHGHAGGHLGNREERIEAAEGFTFYGDAEDGQGGEGGGHTGEMGGATGGGDEEAKAAFFGGAGVGEEAKGGTMSAENANFGGDTGATEESLGGLEGGPIGPATHDQADEGAVALQGGRLRASGLM